MRQFEQMAVEYVLSTLPLCGELQEDVIRKMCARHMAADSKSNHWAMLVKVSVTKMPAQHDGPGGCSA
jgi:hypothetical protein